MAHPIRAVLVVLSLLMAGCAADGDGVLSIGEDPTDVDGAIDGSTPDTVVGDSTATPGPGGTGDPPEPTGAPGEPAPTNSPPSPETTTTTSAPIPPPGAVGGYAGFYLRPSETAALVLDVHAQAGIEPAQTTLDHLSAVLRQVSGKAVTVTGGALAGGGREWTAEDIRRQADAVAPDQSRDRGVLTVLYLKGGFADSETVLGVAVRSDVVAIFGDRVREAAGVLLRPSTIEDAVTIHELGHVLGLVDLVLDTGRQDPEHPGHSQNRNSVMYYAVESTLVGSLLEGGPPRDFDQDDLADLATIRNG